VVGANQQDSESPTKQSRLGWKGSGQQREELSEVTVTAPGLKFEEERSQLLSLDGSISEVDRT